MKTKLFFLACAVVVCGCRHSHQNPSENAAISENAQSYTDKNAAQALNMGKTFVINDADLQNIAISGTISGYKDNVASGELVLTDKNTQKVIQTLPFMLNNESDSVEECAIAEDLDFDGNLDLVVADGVVGMNANGWTVYLYDTRIHKFVKNENLSDAVSSGTSYNIIADKKAVVVYRSAGGGDSSEEAYAVFKIKNKTACQTQWITEDTLEDETQLTLSVQKTDCDGELIGAAKTYKYPPYPDNYKGDGYCRKYIE
jgi:hypothetical protein